VPIFSGGIVQSRVREAMSQRTQSELDLSRVRRQAEQEVRALYQSVARDRTQVAALDKSTTANRLSYQAHAGEYRLGLVTNLDLLQALTAFQQSQRALDRARLTAKSNYLRLLAASARAGLGRTP
jgi:outer membrane protein